MTTVIGACTTTELRDLQAAIQNELDAREQQLTVLTHTLDTLVSSGASDAVVERVLEAIEIIDRARVSADKPHVDEPVSRNREVMVELRALGYVAPGVDQLIRLYHRDLAINVASITIGTDAATDQVIAYLQQHKEK
ncbi:hypothetical protein R2362_03120 [Mycobacteroides chelonae]|nr:hypothetical protein [Mycobacteroides chelonae]